MDMWFMDLLEFIPPTPNVLTFSKQASTIPIKHANKLIIEKLLAKLHGPWILTQDQQNIKMYIRIIIVMQPSYLENLKKKNTYYWHTG